MLGYHIETVLAASTSDDPPSKAPERVSIAAGGVNDALFQVPLVLPLCITTFYPLLCERAHC